MDECIARVTVWVMGCSGSMQGSPHGSLAKFSHVPLRGHSRLPRWLSRRPLPADPAELQLLTDIAAGSSQESGDDEQEL